MNPLLVWSSLERQDGKWLLREDPVKTKNLEKIAGYLQSLITYLSPSNDDHQNLASLTTLLEQIEPSNLSSNNAWELADLLEIELIRLGDDAYLYTLLKVQQNPDNKDPHRWDKYFTKVDLTTLLDSNGKFNDGSRLRAKRLLEHIQQARISEYRRDRAKVQLRGIYLERMAFFLIFFITGLGVFYLFASRLELVERNSTEYRTFLLLLVVWAGATGSILSRAVKLGKQPLGSETGVASGEPPLGIRALLSGWKVFLAQPVIGATMALIVFLVFYSGLLQIGNIKQLGPAGFGVIGFLAGFSEPFFIGILDKVAGQGGASLR
jgi:hypothetical protein